MGLDGWRTPLVLGCVLSKLLLARAISNWHRRPIGRAEKEKWINGLAKIYQEQGVATGGVAMKIAEETGLHQNTVREYLDIKYKDKTQSERASIPRPEQRIPASQRIETELGRDYVERHKEEVLEKELNNPRNNPEKLELFQMPTSIVGWG